MSKIQFFQDAEKKSLRPELLDKEAQAIAQSFLEKEQGRIRNQVTTHQLRRFYGDVKGLEKKLAAVSVQWSEVLPHVKMLKAKIAYATAESKIKSYERRVYGNFRRFIDSAVDSIEDERDFAAFCKQFEAVVGFYYGEGVKS